MISIDIESSGGDFLKHGIFQIGALDTDNPNNYFFETCRIDDDDEIDSDSLRITGATEETLRDKSRQSQKEMIEKFLEWMNTVQVKSFLCHNTQFDHAFIRCKLSKYDIPIALPWRAFDIHSIASIKFLEVNGSLLIKEQESFLTLSKIIEFCGMNDPREEHNALEDAELTAECFARIMYGKNLLKKYTEYSIPQYLKKQSLN
ncbi:MAG: exonuclease domain-containing protein [Candidatus Woesearchaeota archaeon]